MIGSPLSSLATKPRRSPAWPGEATGATALADRWEGGTRGKPAVSPVTTNDAASLLIRLSWPDGPEGPPVVRALRRCPADDRCSPG
jgi:hypothetical protein